MGFFLSLVSKSSVSKISSFYFFFSRNVDLSFLDLFTDTRTTKMKSLMLFVLVIVLVGLTAAVPWSPRVEHRRGKDYPPMVEHRPWKTSPPMEKTTEVETPTEVKTTETPTDEDEWETPEDECDWHCECPKGQICVWQNNGFYNKCVKDEEGKRKEECPYE